MRTTDGSAPSARSWPPPPDEAIWRAARCWSTSRSPTLARLRAGRAATSLAVRGDLNPISEELLAEVRRWLVQPARGQRRARRRRQLLRFVRQHLREPAHRGQRAPGPLRLAAVRRSPSAAAAREGEAHEAAAPARPLRVEDPDRALHRRVAAAGRGGVPACRSPSAASRPSPTSTRRRSGSSLGGAVEVYQAYFDADEGQLPRARREIARRRRRARHRAGRGAGSAARAHPRRATRVVDEWSAPRRRCIDRGARGAAQPGRAARRRKPAASRACWS